MVERVRCARDVWFARALHTPVDTCSSVARCMVSELTFCIGSRGGLKTRLLPRRGGAQDGPTSPSITTRLAQFRVRHPAHCAGRHQGRSIAARLISRCAYSALATASSSVAKVSIDLAADVP